MIQCRFLVINVEGQMFYTHTHKPNTKRFKIVAVNELIGYPKENEANLKSLTVVGYLYIASLLVGLWGLVPPSVQEDKHTKKSQTYITWCRIYSVK